jgi:hypothetical protein
MIVRWLDRYEAGEHILVWEEMRDLGGAIRESAVREDAVAVAHATMRRVRTNIERLIAEWRALGWTFALPDPLARSSDPKASLDRFESEVGPIAIALRAFYEVIGGICFAGRAEREWAPHRSSEILHVEPFEPQLDPLLDADPDFREARIAGLLMAPLPDSGADSVLAKDGGNMIVEGAPLFFVTYLRLVILEHGGLGLSMPPASIRSRLSAALVAF